jgi:molybdopterin-containing oxidoreductase family iron-sulfur binding subunit
MQLKEINQERRMAEDQNKINNTDPNYWQSFEELYRDPDFLKAHQDEFKEGVSDKFNSSEMSSISRRKFLALLGASAAIAGTACSDYRDKGEIIPYNKKPEEIIPGRPNYYASTCTSCANACGVLIKTREGRPIKLDGNPDHPVSKGKICAQGQASIMNLYDPDRIKNPKKKQDGRFFDYNWKAANDEIIFDLMNSGNKEIAIITHKIVSPTTKKVLDEFITKYPSAKIYSYEQFDDSIRNSAWKKCYNSGEFPAIKWNEANIILSLDGDFLGESKNKIENTRLFAEGRDVVNKKFNRLYVVEGNLSITGMNADYRLRLRSDLHLNLLLALINALNKKGANIPVSSDQSLEKFADENGLDKKALVSIVSDLLKNRGKSIVYAGSHLPEDVHIAVNLLNSALGNDVLYNTESQPVSLIPSSATTDFEKLISGMKAGNVAVAIHINSNPVYHLPSDLGYAEALASVDTVVSLVELENETSEFAHHILPIHNQLESWGDAKTRTGFYSLQQPVISPLYDTRQTESIFLTWISGDSSNYSESVYHQYLMNNWENNIYPSLNSKLEFKRFWFGALHDGVVYTNEKSSGLNSINTMAASQIKPSSSSGNFTLQIKESNSIGDGRFANNGWLQELPHPVSKIVWDNYASISPKTADELGLHSNDLVELSTGNNSLTIPVFIQPGSSDNFISIETGFGRKIGGTVGTGVGFNANSLLKSSGGLSPLLYTNVQVKKVEGSYKLVTAQTVYAFNEGQTADLPNKRGIIKEGTVEEYIVNPHFLHKEEKHEATSVNPFIDYTGVKWGMSVDMNKCTGCSDCVVACNVENNIPVVGKDQVDKGREMHWIRIDRYYSGTPEDPKVNNQVMVCQHCDHAPCENVCPVVATTHSPDGLNQMVYNRCVGTRYCSNNCPYKVRRFNYFNFRDHFKNSYQESPVFALLQNPEVTVRSRGVMEKCTFCIQRISDAKAEATREGRDLKGSDVKTACQEACITNAIHFGDINNKEEEFYSYRNNELGYYVLDELNIRPNVTYIAKLKNTSKEEA